MKNIHYTLLFVLALLVIGFGCFRQQPSVLPVPEPPPSVEEVSGIVGVIETVDEAVQMRLVDGTTEQIFLADGSGVDENDIGLLLKVWGTRDLATRQITATTFEVISSPNLYVVSPAPDATVTSPLIVQGFGRTFEQTFQWRIKNAQGEVRQEGFAMTDAPELGVFGPFDFEVFLPATDYLSFTFEVYELSAKDGSETNLVSVPLRLLTAAKSEFNVYFSLDRENPNDLCELVFPVKRQVAQTAAIGRAALLQLLEGPTEQEIAQGYRTNIPNGVTLNSLVISSGVATADFSSLMNTAAGSCRVLAIRSQIINTLSQFETVNDVVISVDGSVDTALQP